MTLLRDLWRTFVEFTRAVDGFVYWPPRATWAWLKRKSRPQRGPR